MVAEALLPWLRPTVILHPVAVTALSEAEADVLRDLGKAIGARRVRVWTGPGLTDDQMLSGRFPNAAPPG